MPLLAALALVCLAATAQQPILDSATHASPSGRVTLRVEPEERTGLRRAEYRLTAGEEVLWSGHRPFALRVAAVGEDGVVAGLAYASDDPESLYPRTVEVFLLSPDGSVLFQESHERRSSLISHMEDVPRALGIFLQPELGRFVVWLEDRSERPFGFLSRFRSYDLRSGAFLSEKRLDTEESLLDVRPVHGTTLLVTSSVRFHIEGTVQRRDAVFQLVDPDWNVLWRREIDDDRRNTRDIATQRSVSSILSTSKERFELWSVLARERISFGVERTGEGWTVSELAHAPHAPTTIEPGRGPEVQARLVARVPLEAGEPSWTPWRTSIDSTQSRILLQDKDSLATQVFDAEGRLLLVCEPRADQRKAAHSIAALGWGVGGSLAMDHDGGVYVGNERGYARFSPTGEPEGVVELGALVGFPPTPGRHWKLESSWLSCSPDLRVDKGVDGSGFRKIEAVAIARDGSLALLDVVERERAFPLQTLLLFDPAGKPQRAIRLFAEAQVEALAYQGGRVLATKGMETLLVDTEVGVIHPLKFDTRKAEGRPCLALSPDGAEVWVLEREARILARYAIGE